MALYPTGPRMGFTEECFRDTPEEMIRQALAIGPDGHSTIRGMEHITFEDLKEQGHIPLASIAIPRGSRFCHTLPDRFPRRRARLSSIRRRWRRRALIPCRDFIPPVDPDGAKLPSVIRWSF